MLIAILEDQVIEINKKFNKLKYELIQSEPQGNTFISLFFVYITLNSAVTPNQDNETSLKTKVSGSRKRRTEEINEVTVSKVKKTV